MHKNLTCYATIIAYCTSMNRFLSALQKNRLGHCVILETDFALEEILRITDEIVAFSSCENRIVNERTKTMHACSVCSSCVRILHKSHDGLIIIKPSENNSQIGVDEIRKLLAETQMKSHASSNRFFVFTHAHALTLNAANCLLKSLEEPKAGQYFLLFTSNSARILQTLRSRAQMFILTADAHPNFPKETISFLFKLLFASYSERFGLIEKLAKDSQLLHLLKDFRLYLIQHLRLREKTGFVAKEQNNLLSMSTTELVAFLSALTIGLQDILNNKNKHLTLEKLFLNPTLSPRIDRT